MLHKVLVLKKFCFRFVFFLSLLLACSFAHSARQVEEVKAAYIFNFLKYVRWSDENTMEALRVGFIGSDKAYLEKCLLLQTRSVRNLAVVVHHIQDLNDIRNFQVIITSKDQNPDLPNIARTLYGAQTLLISDGATEQQLTMINFTYPNPDYVGFEVNRYNLLYEKFEVSSDILLLGGTELDIANLLREMEEELAGNQSQLRKQNEELISVQNRVAKRERELKKQADELKRVQKLVENKERELSDRNSKIAAQDEALSLQHVELEKARSSLSMFRDELSRLENTLTRNKLRLEKSTGLLDRKEKEVSDKETSIKALSDLIETNRALLREQEEQLAEQVSTLEGQRTTIREQAQYLVAAVAVVIAIAIIALLIANINRVRARSNRKLADANKLLQSTQGQLVEAEKMASLGGLVAGVAHEINTPLGVSVTAVSHLDHALKDFRSKFESGNLRRSELEILMADALESTSIMMRNLNRASDLIGNFKQVATDQMVEELRKFELNEYLSEVCQSLIPQLKAKGHQIHIECPEIYMHTYPGALAQVITNLVMNSVLHGFEERRNGSIWIHCEEVDGNVHLDFKDNGVGIAAEQIDKIFEPFYTTKRSQGGTGLGMHISYNLVTQALQGKITCIECEDGAEFHIDMPLRVSAQASESQI